MRQNDRTRPLTLVIAASLTLAACGGSTAGRQTRALSPPAASPAAVPQKDYTNYYPPGTHRASPQAIRVITAWSDQLRAGHVRRAASYFDLPAIVQNATPPTRLASRREALEFNRGLPCGAHVVKLIAGARYTVATFVLTERPGSRSGCGSAGRIVAVAFLLHHGRIREWRRVLVPPPLGPAENLKSALPQN